MGGLQASVADSLIDSEGPLLPSVALLPGEPVGKICTRNAGAVSLSATLTGRPGEALFSDQESAGWFSAPGAWFRYLEGGAAGEAPDRLSCAWEIRAFSEEHLTNALDAALRSITTRAALAEAVLESRAIRLADPFVPSAALVEALARRLLHAGLPVSFGPSRTPLPGGGGIAIGAQGLEDALAEVLTPCRIRAPGGAG